MNTLSTKLIHLKHTIALYSFLLIAWGFYRLLFQFPEPIEVFLIKPVVWLGPTFYLLSREKAKFSSLGFTLRNLFPTLYFILILGVIFTFEGLLINYLKYRTLSFNANVGEGFFLMTFLLSFATAFSEETTFRGFIFTRVVGVANKEWLANLITSLAWTLIHLPIAILDWKLGLVPLLTYLFLLLLFSLGSTFVFARTKNIFSSIFLHVLWQWPIILFR